MALLFQLRFGLCLYFHKAKCVASRRINLVLKGGSSQMANAALQMLHSWLGRDTIALSSGEYSLKAVLEMWMLLLFSAWGKTLLAYSDSKPTGG